MPLSSAIRARPIRAPRSPANFGARVFDVEWENNFSKARNAVLAEVSTEWVLWMDDDEMLDPAGAKWIPALLEANEKARNPIDAFEVVALELC